MADMGTICEIARSSEVASEVANAYLQESSAQPDGKSSKKKQPGPMHEHIMYTLPDSNTRFGKRKHSHCQRCYGARSIRLLNAQ